MSWVPQASGIYTLLIRAAFMFYEDGSEAEDIQTLVVEVLQSSIEMVDPVGFRSGNSPNLFTSANQYFSGGVNRIGAQADGASRLVLRVQLKGAETNSLPTLHFAIGGRTASGTDA